MGTPIAKLISGQGSVTDGLILRITTEGLFIDDDVRGVPQREWDIKAWTLKTMEVCCRYLYFAFGIWKVVAFSTFHCYSSNGASDADFLPVADG